MKHILMSLFSIFLLGVASTPAAGVIRMNCNVLSCGYVLLRSASGITAIVFLLMQSMASTATETCSMSDIRLNSQWDVDNFQSVYGTAGGVCDEVSNNLVITNVSNLTNLNGLANLRRIGGNLEIHNNDSGSASNSSNSLTDITGLRNIEYVGNGFEIIANSMLSDCHPVAYLLGYPYGEQNANVGSYIIVNGNADGCNSVEEIYWNQPFTGEATSSTVDQTDGDDSGDYFVEPSNPMEGELFRLNIEEPDNGGTAAGISNLRGWALAASGIERLELFVDGAFVSEIPYGGIRGDVEMAYPEVQDSLNSGFGQTINFNNMGSGQHTVTIRAISRDGELLEQQSTFSVEAITQTFLPPEEAPDLTDAAVSIASTDEIAVRGLKLADGSERNVVLKWSPARQDFVTTTVIDPGETVSETEYNDLNSRANVFTAPATIVGNLASLTDEDWFELSTDRNNRMIDVTFSSLPNNSPGNLGKWEVEWFGKLCPDKEGVTLSKRNLAIRDEGFTYSVPACEQGVYRVAIRVPQNYSYFHDSGEYSLQISLSDWP